MSKQPEEKNGDLISLMTMQVKLQKRSNGLACAVLVLLIVFMAAGVWAFNIMNHKLDRVEAALDTIVAADIPGVAEDIIQTAGSMTGDLNGVLAQLAAIDLDAINQGVAGIAEIDFEALNSSIVALKNIVEPVAAVIQSLPIEQ